jgi:CDP-diglyceride synthetase
VKELLKNRKFVISSLLFVSFWAFQVYASYNAGPVLAKKMIAYNQSNPFSWFDFLGGALSMFLVMTLFIIGHSLYFSARAERRNKSGDPGDGGGGWNIQLPILKKVVSITDFKKIPTNGRIHMGTAEA